MRVVFAGTPPFASVALESLVSAGHDVGLVLTRPDRPAGRGLRLASSDVAATATRLGLEVAKPSSLRDSATLERISAAAPDVLVVAAYGLILPRAVLDIPRRGCLNIHASLLPRWRGAAPIQRCILAGDPQTGVCIMRMDEGLDTGPVILAKATELDRRETAGALTARLATMGAEAIVEALARLEELPARAQDRLFATYAAKVEKQEAVIDWSRPAVEIDRKVRAFSPVPGAEATIEGMRLKIWEAEPAPGAGFEPGALVMASGGELTVGCGDGLLKLLRVQRSGARPLSAAEFLRGNPWPARSVS